MEQKLQNKALNLIIEFCQSEDVQTEQANKELAEKLIGMGLSKEESAALWRLAESHVVNNDDEDDDCDSDGDDEDEEGGNDSECCE